MSEKEHNYFIGDKWKKEGRIWGERDGPRDIMFACLWEGWWS